MNAPMRCLIASSTAVLIALGAACDAPQPSDATIATDAADAAIETDVEVVPGRRLGLNDLTVLLPLPGVGTPSLVAPATLVPNDLWQRLVVEPGDVFTDFDSLRVAAVRFDLCDRVTTGPCPSDADGRLRLVLQTTFPNGESSAPTFADTALHAFYPIPRAELAGVVAELRRLAVLQDRPASPLEVNVALADPTSQYAVGLQALVARYADGERIVRLTLFSQLSISAALNWVFRGEERATPTEPFVVMPIADIDGPFQRALLLGDTSFQVTPTADAPAGLALALSSSAFAAAGQSDQRGALEALAAIDDPRAHTPTSVQCVACHVTTVLLPLRAARAGVDVATLDAGFRADDETLDLEPPNLPMFDRTLRALGYLGDVPLVSQRVVHETAVVLAEIEARFPASRN